MGKPKSTSTTRRRNKPSTKARSTRRVVGQWLAAGGFGAIILAVWLQATGRATLLEMSKEALLRSIGMRGDLPLEALRARYALPPSSFVHVDGVPVHFRDERPSTVAARANEGDEEGGTSLPLLLLHGTSSSLHTWDGWTKELLRAGRRVVRLDLVGFGLTGPHVDKNFNYSVQSLARFVANFARTVGLERVVLVGNSLGGQIAGQVAGLYPKLVERLVLVDAAGPYPREKSMPLIFRIVRIPYLNRLLRNITPRWIIRMNLHEVYYDDNKVTEELVERYYDLTLREGNRDVFLLRAQLLSEENLEEQRKVLQAIKVPTLLQWGEHDHWTDLSIATKLLVDIQGATMKNYPNAAHVPMEEIPVETAADLLRWLNALDK